jgi:CRISPR-associated protein Csd2
MADPVWTNPDVRHDFVFLFDVQDGNPNGDPDAGNLPRVDPETMHGLVTDVCLKRKLRNYILMSRWTDGRPQPGFDIYVKEGASLNREHRSAYDARRIEVAQASLQPLPQELLSVFVSGEEPGSLPEGFTLEPGGDTGSWNLRYSGELDPKEKKAALDTIGKELGKKAKDFCSRLVSGAKSRRPTPDEIEDARGWMCEHFYDVRIFGGVLSTGLNCGQVRGPIQLTFARSIDPIAPFDLSITRCAVTREEDLVRKDREMGRKALVPYGLYRGYGFFSPHFARKTKVSRADLALFWDALRFAWDNDHSAARGLMGLRGLFVFTHPNALGVAPAHRLFDQITVQRREGVATPRRFGDYKVLINKEEWDVTKPLVDRPLQEGVLVNALAG